MEFLAFSLSSLALDFLAETATAAELAAVSLYLFHVVSPLRENN